jgi:hypothetical protein
MDIKLNGYEMVGIIFIIVSVIFLLAGNLIGQLYPMTQKIFESSIMTIVGFIGILFIGEGRKKKRQIE